MNFSIVILLFLSLSTAALSKDVRIYGGMDTNIRYHPYAVSIRHYATNHLLCTGSIVGKKHVITSAHCISPFIPEYVLLRVFSGTSSSSKTSSFSSKVSDIDVHPGFLNSMDGDAVYRYDLAILTVKKGFDYNELQNKIELPNSNVWYGEIAVMVGWGKKGEKEPRITENLQEAFTAVVNKKICSKSHPFTISDDQICVFKSAGVGICFGDVGGPLVSNGKLIGIASFGVPCAVGVSDIFTNVFECIDFIRSIVPYEKS